MYKWKHGYFFLYLICVYHYQMWFWWLQSKSPTNWQVAEKKCLHIQGIFFNICSFYFIDVFVIYLLIVYVYVYFCFLTCPVIYTRKQRHDLNVLMCQTHLLCRVEHSNSLHTLLVSFKKYFKLIQQCTLRGRVKTCTFYLYIISY